MSKAIKLVLVLANSSSMIKTIKKDDVALKGILCIYYPIKFKKNEVEALINSSSEINVMALVYAAKLGLKVYYTNVRAQKIDGSIFKTFVIVLASF